MTRRLLAGVFGMLAMTSVAAHHSPAAFDRTKEVKLAGTVKEFRWQNPHSWIEIMVPNDRGEAVLWSVELTSPTYLVRAGWKSNTIKAGDKVAVVVRPMRNGTPGGSYVSIKLADGTVLNATPPAATADGQAPAAAGGQRY